MLKMSTTTVLARFVFATLLLTTICMAQNPWFPTDTSSTQSALSGTSPGFWSNSKSQSSIFGNDNYTIRILIKSIKDIIRFSIVYCLSLATKLFPDRYQYLRNVADGINGIVDCFSHYYHIVLNICFAICNFFQRIPIIGFVVTLALHCCQSLWFIPQLVITFIVDIIKGFLL